MNFTDKMALDAPKRKSRKAPPKAVEAEPRWHVRLDTAIAIATKDADSTRLPQTVFRNQDTCGWANTNPFAMVLSRSECSVTILPESYFR